LAATAGASHAGPRVPITADGADWFRVERCLSLSVMKHTALALVLVALTAAACHSATAVHVTPVRAILPAHGECVGTVEVTVVNEGSRAVNVGKLSLVMSEERPGMEAPVVDPGAALAMFEPPWTGEPLLGPGETRVLKNTVVRTMVSPSSPFLMEASVPTFNQDNARSEWTSESVRFDPSAWPVAEPLTAASIDRAVAEGREVRILFYEITAPKWGVRMLDVRGDGTASGLAAGTFGDSQGNAVAGKGTLEAAQLAELVAAIRGAPIDAFRADPQWKNAKEGDRVRLLVAAGRSARELLGVAEDFRTAGLEPLVERLRALIASLPQK
jgi:hypothetical protein